MVPNSDSSSPKRMENMMFFDTEGNLSLEPVHSGYGVEVKPDYATLYDVGKDENGNFCYFPCFILWKSMLSVPEFLSYIENNHSKNLLTVVEKVAKFWNK